MTPISCIEEKSGVGTTGFPSEKSLNQLIYINCLLVSFMGCVLPCGPKETSHFGCKDLIVALLLSCVWLFSTPWTAACQASLSFTISRVCSNSCPLNQWCHPTISSSVTPSPSALNLSQHQSLFQWVGHQVANALELQLQHLSFRWIFRVDFLQEWLVWLPCSPRQRFHMPGNRFLVLFNPAGKSTGDLGLSAALRISLPLWGLLISFLLILTKRKLRTWLSSPLKWGKADKNKNMSPSEMRQSQLSFSSNYC